MSAPVNKNTDFEDDTFETVVQGHLIAEEALTQKVAKTAITPWSLNDFDEVELKREQDKQESILQEVEKQIQPELNKRTEVLKKEIYDSAYQKGYDAGFKVGQEEGEANGKSQAYSETREFLFPKLEAANRLLQALKTPQKELQETLFQEIVQFSTYLAEQIIGEHTVHNSDWLLRIIQESVMSLPESEQQIEVLLNPADLAFLQELQPDWITDWHMTADPKVQAGNCLVKQHHSSVHNVWQERFESLKSQVKTNNEQLKNDASETAKDEDSLNSVPWEEAEQSKSKKAYDSQAIEEPLDDSKLMSTDHENRSSNG